jgi:gliding motility-associated-like protein
MTNNSLYSTNFFWDFGNGNTDYSNSVNDSISSLYGTNGLYDIALVSFNGICSDTSFYQVNVIENETSDSISVVLIPNFLTPNNDNVNDYFGIFTNVSYSGKIQILNRWGNVVFENDFVSDESNFTPLWDGSQSSEGVYFYKIMLFDEKFNEQFSGYFHLIR